MLGEDSRSTGVVESASRIAHVSSAKGQHATKLLVQYVEGFDRQVQ
jgi:hypothetical protein